MRKWHQPKRFFNSHDGEYNFGFANSVESSLLVVNCGKSLSKKHMRKSKIPLLNLKSHLKCILLRVRATCAF